MNRKIIVGIETHVQLKTKSKMFCSCSAEYFGSKPNVNVCPVCLGYPGALPKVNEEAIVQAIRVGKLLNFKNINSYSSFERKNYMYPDLFKGFQITQYKDPILSNGYLDIRIQSNVDSHLKATPIPNMVSNKINIYRAHLEEDTAKSLHEDGYTLIDGNKAGVPLLEIVSAPDLDSAIEAKEYAKTLYNLLRYSNISDCDMEKGQMRFDININLEITDDDGRTLYTPIVEVKNLNSFRSLERAINFEEDFQFEEFKKNRIEKNKGNKVTKGWNDIKGETIFQRGKEESDDYRYFPEPDLPPLVLSQKFIDSVTVENSAMDTMEKLKEDGVSDSSATILVLTLGLEFVHIFDQMRNEYHGDLSSLANWVINDLAGIISENDVDISSIDVQKLVNILNLVSGKELTSTSAKEIIYKMIVKNENVDELISSRKVINDDGEIDKCVDEVLGENQELIQTYLNGKEGVLSFFIGQVMKKMQGRASPSDIKNKLLIKISKFR